MKITTGGRPAALLGAVLLFAGLGLVACAPESGPAEPGPSETTQAVSLETGFKIGLLLPDESSTRYETQDRPGFEAAVKAACPKCEVLYANANQDAAKQQQQANSMLTQGVKVLVVDPWDGVAAAAIVDQAVAQKVPVIAYDRLIKSPQLSYIISNNYEKVGELQGQALVEKLKADNVPAGSGIVMLNGATTDNNAVNIRKGALSQIEPAGYKVLAHIETWDGPTAEKFASSQIAKFGTKIAAFYSANDGNALAAIAAMNAAGMKLVPTTGLDATLASVQSILAGQQYMTVYNSFKGEAEQAVKVALDLAQGKTPTSTDTVDGIPAFLQQPQAVTADTVATTVVKDGVYKTSDICTTQYAAACTAHNIK
ncbi:substrate-binding domain-containing protein [Microbacterium sp. SYP-A9085]|uniref:substrate-binding domain-containing protein n=1 Tax=Microbacterium sp. SYP-A9085 TaxID=2664454 RepID=UPI00129A9D08|nr:substrate-binding domain-containing protein [Microbacterium sp. SYP-A9085]MRH30100.1 substrate-binding domain-containing protein [Microbacterium sp. SYP-A9085]